MTLKEAAAELWKLSQGSVHRKYLMPQVNALLKEFENANGTGNGYASEKIHDVRGWFDELGTLGRGHYSIEQARMNVQQSIGKLEHLINSDGTGLCVEFGFVPAVTHLVYFGRRETTATV